MTAAAESTDGWLLRVLTLDGRRVARLAVSAARLPEPRREVAARCRRPRADPPARHDVRRGADRIAGMFPPVFFGSRRGATAVDGSVAGGVARSVDRSGGAPVVGDTIQIGIAVDIPEPWGGALTQRRVEAGDPLVVPAHVTLLGPTEIPVAALPAVERHLAAVAAAHLPFTLHLRGTGTFRPVTQVVFVAVAAGISECELLAAAISRARAAPGARFPYHPHVTVAQDVRAGGAGQGVRGPGRLLGDVRGRLVHPLLPQRAGPVAAAPGFPARRLNPRAVDVPAADRRG